MDDVAHLVILWDVLKMFCIHSEKQMASRGTENWLVASVHNNTEKAVEKPDERSLDQTCLPYQHSRIRPAHMTIYNNLALFSLEQLNCHCNTPNL